jgi:hypothetical protein
MTIEKCMKRMRTFLLMLIISLSGGVLPAASGGAGTSPPSAAPPSEAEALAKDLLRMTAGDFAAELADNVSRQTWPPLEESLRSQHPQIDAATTEELRDEYKKQMVSYLTQVFFEDAPPIYVRYFSVPELRDLKAFYHTSTGAKALKVMPQMMADLMPIIASRLQGLGEHVDTAFHAILQKHGLTE